jgi:hypothetical protein
MKMFENEYFKAYIKTSASLLSTEYFSFSTLSVVRRNTVDGSSDQSATTKTDREVFLKTVLFAH